MHNKATLTSVDSIQTQQGPVNSYVKLIDSAALSDWLGVPYSTISQWSYRHVGPPVIKVGRHRRYDPTAVRRWLDAQTHHPHQQR